MSIIIAAMMLWLSALQFENNVRATKMTKKKEKKRPKAAYRAVIRNRGFKSCLSQRKKTLFWPKPD